MGKLYEFLGKIIDQIINPLILLLTAVAFAVMVWGIFIFVKDAGDETARSKGRAAIGWGLIGLVIMFGAYGILNIALKTFNVNPGFEVQPGFLKQQPK